MDSCYKWMAVTVTVHWSKMAHYVMFVISFPSAPQCFHVDLNPTDYLHRTTLHKPLLLRQQILWFRESSDFREKLIHIPFGVLTAPSPRPVPLTSEVTLSIQLHILKNMKSELQLLFCRAGTFTIWCTVFLWLDRTYESSHLFLHLTSASIGGISAHSLKWKIEL